MLAMLLFCFFVYTVCPMVLLPFYLADWLNELTDSVFVVLLSFSLYTPPSIHPSLLYHTSPAYLCLGVSLAARFVAVCSALNLHVWAFVCVFVCVSLCTPCFWYCSYYVYAPFFLPKM